MKKILFCTIITIAAVCNLNLQSACDPKSPRVDETSAKNRCVQDWQCDAGRKCSRLNWCENCSK